MKIEAESKEFYRLMSVMRAVKLEILGKRFHETPSITAQAHAILEANGISPAQKKTMLLKQLEKLCKSVQG